MDNTTHNPQQAGVPGEELERGPEKMKGREWLSARLAQHVYTTASLQTSIHRSTYTNSILYKCKRTEPPHTTHQLTYTHAPAHTHSYTPEVGSRGPLQSKAGQVNCSIGQEVEHCYQTGDGVQLACKHYTLHTHSCTHYQIHTHLFMHT